MEVFLGPAGYGLAPCAEELAGVSKTRNRAPSRVVMGKGECDYLMGVLPVCS